MARHYAIFYGFHMLSNLLKKLARQAFVYKQRPRGSLRVFSTDSGMYGSLTKGHSVGPLVLTLFVDKK